MHERERGGFAGLALRMAMGRTDRFFAHLLAMALIAFVLAGALLLGQGIAQESARSAGRLGADIMIVPKETGVSAAALIGGITVGASLPEGIATSIAAMAGVTRVAPQYVFRSAADPCCEHGDILLVGFDPSRDFSITPWLRPEDRLPADDGEILAGARVMKAPGAAMRFFNRTFTLASRLEKSGSAPFDTALFVPLEGLKAMARSSRAAGSRFSIPWGRPSILLLMLEPSLDQRQTALALEGRHPGIQALAIDEAARSSRLRLERRARGQASLAAAAWLIALLAGGLFLFSTLRQRRTSLGLLRSFGWGKWSLALLFALETFVLSLAGMAAGSLTAGLALTLGSEYLALATGVPLPSGWLPRAAAAISWGVPTFAGALSIVASIIVLFLLRRAPADLLRSSR